jgi:hypothetical protein
MKLKFELLNGFGVLVDEEAEIREGDWFFLDMTDNDRPNELHQMGTNKKSKTGGINFSNNTAWTQCCFKIIFAEKELGLDVPVFEWRDFEVEKLAETSYGEKESDANTDVTFALAKGYINGFKDGHKSNPAKYTEEDLRKAIEMARRHDVNLHSGRGCTLIPQINNEEIIQSLQKYPKYAVMENNTVKELI